VRFIARRSTQRVTAGCSADGRRSLPPVGAPPRRPDLARNALAPQPYWGSTSSNKNAVAAGCAILITSWR